VQVNIAYKDFIHNQKRFELLWGGAGSSKSYTVAQKKVLKCISYPYFKCVASRKIKETLKNSCYAILRKVIYNEGLTDQFKFTTSPLGITHIPTGNEFIFLGMQYEDDREKIKSIVDPTDWWMEEANEFDEDDFTQANIRLRGDNNTPKQLTLTLNGVNREHWIKRKLIDSGIYTADLFELNSNYTHNKFLDEQYKKALEDLIHESEYYYNVYVLGQWGVIDVKGRIYKRFVSELFPKGNIFDYKYDPNYPVILCCDFNVNPQKWALIQNIKGIDYVFDELVKEDTDTELMAIALRDKFKNEYDTEITSVPLYVYGDASGTYRQPSAKSTDYQIIQRYFPHSDLRNNIYNPPVIDRFNAMNWRLCNKEGVRRLLVAPKCKHVIYSLENDKFKEGKREEDKSLEKYTNDPIEALIHITSAIGYYITKEYSLRGKSYVHQA
jgi:phage terminase large subunit